MWSRSYCYKIGSRRSRMTCRRDALWRRTYTYLTSRSWNTHRMYGATVTDTKYKSEQTTDQWVVGHQMGHSYGSYSVWPIDSSVAIMCWRSYFLLKFVDAVVNNTVEREVQSTGSWVIFMGQLFDGSRWSRSSQNVPSSDLIGTSHMARWQCDRLKSSGKCIKL